jgi:(1->4)-alpha-D-glucan 1-alpha-D-glucosylmutase
VAASSPGKFQQLTAPTTAKGIEDTAFYIYNRFVSLNEVGGEPGHFGVTPIGAAPYLADRQKRWPYALSPLSTHDTKRSEDVRARLNVLSEIPDEWAAHVTERGPSLNEPHRATSTAARPTPTRSTSSTRPSSAPGRWSRGHAWKTPTFVERVQAYLQKAMREAKVHELDRPERAVRIRGDRLHRRRILDERPPNSSPTSAPSSAHRELGLLNSLAQTLLRLTAPGVPDTYQGTELWDFSLVDPDNRRPVDYTLRRRLLDEVRTYKPGRGDSAAPDLSADQQKLYITWKSLTHRRSHPALFSAGEYLPAPVAGPRAENLFAFARRESVCPHRRPPLRLRPSRPVHVDRYPHHPPRLPAARLPAQPLHR